MLAARVPDAAGGRIQDGVITGAVVDQEGEQLLPGRDDRDEVAIRLSSPRDILEYRSERFVSSCVISV